MTIKQSSSSHNLAPAIVLVQTPPSSYGGIRFMVVLVDYQNQIHKIFKKEWKKQVQIKQ